MRATPAIKHLNRKFKVNQAKALVERFHFENAKFISDHSLFEVSSINNCLVSGLYQSDGLSRATDCFNALIASSFLFTAIHALAIIW